MPKRVCASSVRPAPRSPVIPRISPRWTAHDISSYSPSRRKFRTSSTAASPLRSRACTVVSMARPVMSSASRWWVMVPASNTPTRRLSRSTVMRSAISMSSTSRWLTNTTAMPAAESRRTTARSARVSDWVSDAVGSSMKTMDASATRARQIATTWRLAIESDRTGWSRSSSKPRRPSISRAVRRMAGRREGRGKSPRFCSKAMFSATPRCGKRARSCQITCTPRRRAMPGVSPSWRRPSNSMIPPGFGW